MRWRGCRVETTEHTLLSRGGYRIAARVHRPQKTGPMSAVLLCPGSNDPGSVFHGWTQPLNAMEVASTGVVVMDFDPAGRGQSWGPEDYGGEEHQDDVAVCLRYLREHLNPVQLGVVSISLGLCMSAGALARCGEEVGVDWLLDWEGPSDRQIITAGGRNLAPAMGRGLEDEAYWRRREPVHHVASMSCGYVRIQSLVDHAQPGELRHATRLIQAAASGSPRWFRLNEHTRNTVPSSPQWCARGRLQANRILLREIGLLT
ncbi:MAG: hypothetical protein VX519_04685 [Myxococcota bacterium]|nr:hypothetical protein [Myxococcota bacterium]